MESDESYQEAQSSSPESVPDEAVTMLNESNPLGVAVMPTEEDSYPPIEPLPASWLSVESDPQEPNDTSPPEITTPRLKVVMAPAASSSSGSSNPPDITSRIDYQVLNLLTDCQQGIDGLGSVSIADDLAKMISDDIEVKLQLIRNRLKSSHETETACHFLEILRARALKKELNVKDLDDLKANIDLINSIRRLAVMSWKLTIEKNLETYDPDDTEVKTIQDLLSRLDDDKSIELWCSFLMVASKNFREMKWRKSQGEKLTACNRAVEEGMTAFESKVYKELLMNDMMAIKDLILLNDYDEFVIFNKSITLFYKIYAIHSLASLIFSPSKHLLALHYVNADFLHYFIKLFDESEWIYLKAYHEKLSHLIEFEEKYVVDLKAKVAIGEQVSHEAGEIVDITDNSDRYNTKCSEDFRQALHWCFQLHPDDGDIDPKSSKAKIYQEMPSATRKKYKLIYNALFEAYLELINGTDVDAFISREELITALRQIIHHVRRMAEGSAPSAQLYASLLYQQPKPLSAIWDEEKKRGHPPKTPLMESLLDVYVPVVEQLLLEPLSLTLAMDSSRVSGSVAMPHDISDSIHQRHTVPTVTPISSHSKSRGLRSLSLFEPSTSSSSSSSAPNSPLSPRQSQLSPRGVFNATTCLDIRGFLPSSPPSSPRTSWLDSLKRGTYSNSSPSLPLLSPRDRAHIGSGSLSPRAETPPPSPRSKPSISSLFTEMVDELRRQVGPSDKGFPHESPSTTPR